MEKTDGSAAAEWRENWPVVLAGIAGITLFTVHTYSMGVMIIPIEAELGWSRSQISSGPMIVAFCGVILAPVVGMVIDRFGPRRVGVIGASLLCIAVALLSTTTASIWSWWILWSALALCAVFVGPTVWTAAVSSLFYSGRGLALAVTLCGTGLGASLVPIVSSHLVESHGWRMGYLGLAGFWGLLTLPLVYLFFSSAADRHRLGRPASSVTPADALTGVSAREGITSLRFIKLAMAAALLTLGASGLIVNLVPILTADGVSRSTAAATAGLIGVGSIIGRLCGGYLLDRINGNLVAGVSAAMPIITSVLLLYVPGSVAAGFAAVLILGLAVGAEFDAAAYLAARHFGLRSFGALFGTISGLLVLTNGLGPLLANYAYDLTHSYYPALWAMVPICLLSSTLFLTLGPYPARAPAGEGQPTEQKSPDRGLRRAPDPGS